MRLIDRDKLEDAFDWIIDPCVRHDVEDTLKEQKEIKAIPIDWLKKKYFNKRTIYSDRSLARQMAVKELIKEWEDEVRSCN